MNLYEAILVSQDKGLPSAPRSAPCGILLSSELGWFYFEEVRPLSTT
jgi:hypothetical protein